MPVSAADGCSSSHWDDVLRVVKEALFNTEFSVELVSNSDEIGIIHKRIVQNIYNNEMVVCDVSAKNPNVMFELGMRLAFDKPAIIIKDDQTNYSFDTAAIEHIEYPRTLGYHAIQEFKATLRNKVVATYDASKQPEYTTFLKHFGQFVVANNEEEKIAKDNYLLEAISELRKEVLAHGKTTARGPIYGLAVAHLRKQIESTRSHMEIAMYDFLKNYLRDEKITTLDDLFNSDSELFKVMFKEFQKSSYGSSLTQDPVQVKKALLVAARKFINKLRVND